jgi:hypothetical protein
MQQRGCRLVSSLTLVPALLLTLTMAAGSGCRDNTDVTTKAKDKVTIKLKQNPKDPYCSIKHVQKDHGNTDVSPFKYKNNKTTHDGAVWSIDNKCNEGTGDVTVKIHTFVDRGVPDLDDAKRCNGVTANKPSPFDESKLEGKAAAGTDFDIVGTLLPTEEGKEDEQKACYTYLIKVVHAGNTQDFDPEFVIY